MSETAEIGRGRPKVAKGRWREVVLVCGKCSKRQGLGRGGLRKRLKQAAKAEAHRKLKVVEVGCLGLCPGKGVVAATGTELSRGRMLVLPPGVPGEDALRLLLPGAIPGAAERPA